MFKFTALLLLGLLVVFTSSHPAYEEDLETAASEHHHGRVQIKVFRGPSEGHEHFAPWGYWVKQPADAEHH